MGDEITPADANFLYAEHGERIGPGVRTPVGRYAANAFGLCDLHGNVCEWVEDVWHAGYAGAPADGAAWVTDGDPDRRVIRGGAWDYLPRLLRSAWRDSLPATQRRDNVGFRIARRSNPDHAPATFPLTLDQRLRPRGRAGRLRRRRVRRRGRAGAGAKPTRAAHFPRNCARPACRSLRKSPRAAATCRRPADSARHLDDFCRKAEASLECAPLFLTVLAGCDAWPLAQSVDFFGRAIEAAASLGVIGELRDPPQPRHLQSVDHPAICSNNCPRCG